MNKFFRNILEHKYTLLIGGVFLVHFLNMFIDVMEIDAAQYAAISSEMFTTKSYLQVYFNGNDYLDKPPLLFWLNCISFSIFGISNFSYKFFAVLSLIFSIYATYRFARLWYSNEIAKHAALILASCQAYFLMTNDVRTDGLLTAWVIVSVWLITEFLQKNKLKFLLFGALATGLALLAKGPIALIAVVIAIGSDLFFKRKWKEIFRWEWVLFLLVTALVLLPMSYGLYQQFDLHPEKIVYDLKGPSGLRFFFWTQSFGRITGEIYWNNNAPFSFFFQTILWDYQPWILLFILALFYPVYLFLKLGFKSNYFPEYSSITSFILLFLLLSLSNYKLPHYIFITFPFASIILAYYLHQVLPKTLQILAKVQMIIIHLFFILITVNFIWFFTPSTFTIPLLCILLLILIWISYKKLQGIAQLLVPTLILSITFNLVLSLNFYPNLLKYQSSSAAGKWIHEQHLQKEQVLCYNSRGYALDFYSGFGVNTFKPSVIYNSNYELYIYTDEEGKTDLEKKQYKFSVVQVFDDYHITSIRLEFLNRKTRNETLKKCYLLKLDRLI